MMRNFCTGEILDKPSSGVVVIVGIEGLEVVPCMVDVASVVAVSGWHALRKIVKLSMAEIIKALLVLFFIWNQSPLF